MWEAQEHWIEPQGLALSTPPPTRPQETPQAPEWQRKPLNEGATGQLCGPRPSPRSSFLPVADSGEGKARRGRCPREDGAPERMVMEARGQPDASRPGPCVGEARTPQPDGDISSAQQHARRAPLPP